MRQKGGRTMLNKLKLSTRILILGILSTVCFVLIFTWMIPKVKKNMYEAKNLKTRHVVEVSWGILDYYAKQANTGAMPLEEAKRRVKESIRNLRYDNDDYFWINDAEPRMVMHPIKPEMDGKSLSEEKDPTGKRFFVEMAEVCRSKGAGFVEYQWPKPGAPKPVPKISYVKLHPEWGWIIGSGIYLDDVEKELSQIIYVITGVVTLIAAGSLSFAFFMARSISLPINRTVEGLSGGVEQVASASSQVSSASQSLAEGASEQAAGIEETSSSIEEMASMTRQNADNANQANALMAETSRVVDEANRSMTELTGSMKEISTASEETAKIIKTIDEIAFQTNLLALNAAVEAARAGEAGAGFAVVADEVRNLAMRAADAAKNTANLIEGTVKKVKNGSDTVSKTNEAFAKVSAGAKKVGELVGEISAASSEQAQGIEQINKAVAEMDKVVQKNAASAEESASASEEMNAQAAQMKGFVDELAALVYGINGDGNGAKIMFHQGRDGRQPVTIDHQAKGKIGVHKILPALGKKEKAKMREVAALKAKELKPDQVIPLGEHDFKEF